MSKKHDDITDEDVFQRIEIIPNRLFFCPSEKPPANTAECFYFTIDFDSFYEYHTLICEYGPPSLLQVHRFYKHVCDLLKEHTEEIQFFCFDDAYRFTTAVCYICTFKMLYEGASADTSFAPFKHLEPCFMEFGDASTLPTTHRLSVPWYLRGFAKGMAQNWYSPAKFDDETWELISRSESGDMNWIIPGKLLAFASPWTRRELPGGFKVCIVSDVVKTFKKLGISHVVRLNERLYDEKDFRKAGFRHTDLNFPDGSVPPVRIRTSWLNIIDGKDVVALHCKAGLGRTGTLAGVYLIKKYGFTGDEAIGWIRLCRPGSIMGPQQKYLIDYAKEIKKSRRV